MPGVPALRKVISEVIANTYHRPTDFDTEVTITAGGTEAIFSTIAALIGSNDEVILFDPAYDCYDPAIRLNGGIPIHINLKQPHFAIDWQEVQDKITPNTKLILVNTPHNPSGAVLNDSDMLALQEIALKHNLIVLSDEVYERIVFDGIQHQSILRYPTLAKQAVAVFSFGKTFHATGWKVGYTVASEELTREIRKTHQFITFSVNTPIQFALAEYLKESKNYMYLGKFYQQKRDFFLGQIRGSSLKPLPCFGSYFQLLSYDGVSTKNEMEMAAWMTKEKGLAPIPVSAFYKDGSDQKLLRFCFAKSDTTLESAGKILRMI
jgi:methionine aminotransferase